MTKKLSKLSRAGMSIEEIYNRADEFRKQIINLIIENNELSIKQLANKLETDMNHVRNHTDLLYEMGCIDKHKVRYEMFFSVTGKEYVSQRKASHRSSYNEKVASQLLPHARVIRLLDRQPNEISKEEHDSNRRRSQRSVFHSSSMTMFDSY